MTQQCPTCGKHLDGGVRFCPHDGTPLTETAATTPQRTPTHPSATQKVPTLELPVMVGNRYRLIELRGGGGMARVYKAIDVTLEREVAVKLINPELRADPEFDARFQREARIASQLHDPHIVVVHDFGLDPQHGPYLVMEFLQGQSLRERMASGPLPLKAGLQLGAQLILALIHAHDKGIVHRDIKPDNIFLLNISGVRLHVRVLDFGIARIYRGDDTAQTGSLTHPGAVLGTPRYMSPEQLAGQPVDARSDLYSAAMVIHEALTGHLPYVTGKKLQELCPDASPALQELLDQCLKPSPGDRPASAIEVYLRLQELGKASGILLLPPGAMDKLVAARQISEPTVAYVPPPGGTRGRRRWLGLAGAAAALLLIGGVGVGYWVTRPPPEPNPLTLAPGDRLDKAVVVMGGAPEREGQGDPWGLFPTSSGPGKVLRKEDFATSGQVPAILTALSWKNDRVWVVLQEDVIRAVVVRASYPAVCPRGVRVGDPADRVAFHYSEEPTSIKTEKLGMFEKVGSLDYVEVRRYDPLGIGFEVQSGHVVGITRYPTRP